MYKKRVKITGFGKLGIILILIAIALAGAAGWVVYKGSSTRLVSSDTHKPSTNKTSSKLSDLLVNQTQAPSGDTSTPTETQTNTSTDQSNSSSSSETTSEVSYSSEYDGFHFSYLGTWSNKIWENDQKGSAVTITSPGSNVLLSYGTPVIPPSSSTCGEDSPKLYIYAVLDVPNYVNSKELYIIKYSDQSLKSVALTDWEGKKPVIGQTDKCSGYQPAFINKQTGIYSWFKISDISESYRSLSPSVFFATSDVEDAVNFIKSGTY